MIIVMSVLGLTSGDLESHAAATRREQGTRQLSTMRFDAGRQTTALTLASTPGLTMDTNTTSGFSHPTDSDSVLDITKGGEIKLEELGGAGLRQ